MTTYRIFYEEVGNGQPLILLHGFGASHSIWGRLVYELRSKYQLVCPDLRGHGDSDKPAKGYSISTFSEDVSSLIKNLNLKKVSFLGWSAGASVGIRLASLYPEMIKKLILVGGSPCWGRKPDFPWGHDAKLIESWKKEILEDYPGWMYRSIELMFEKQTDERMKSWMWNIGMRLPIHASIDMIEDASTTDLRDLLANIRSQTALFHGAHDRLNFPMAAKYMASKIPNCELVEFRESGHSPFLEEPALFLKELEVFLGNDDHVE